MATAQGITKMVTKQAGRAKEKVSHKWTVTFAATVIHQDKNRAETRVCVA
jgi:hypothetical protein